jgi:hypothetical protein
MAYALGKPHKLEFLASGIYYVTVTADESQDPPLADNQCCFELQYETAIITGDQKHLKSRLDDNQDNCSYAMNDEGDNCLTPPGDQGNVPPVANSPEPGMTTCTSAPLQIDSSDQWVVEENGRYFLHIFPRIGDATLAPCENLNGEGPIKVDDKPHTPDAPMRFAYTPPDPPPGGKKMGKKKIKVIWKKDH